MALNIKNADVEKLVEAVVALTGESKTEAVRKALAERHVRLAYGAQLDDVRLRRFLEEELWPQVPAEVRGKPLAKAAVEELLGYGADGV